MEDFAELQAFLLGSSSLTAWGHALPELVAQGLNPQRYGDLPGWQAAVAAMPRVQAKSLDLRDSVTIGSDDEVDAATSQAIADGLRQLIPWRKGPLWLFGTHIETEWRSDWKWQRLLPHIAPLQDRLVLDVGCGNGYHCWRMLGEGARRVIGVDPSPRFVVQFYATKRFASHCPVDVLPATLDHLPNLPAAFDTVFSMGVLYHRPAPFEHLKQLQALLRPGGQLVLETLVIEGGLGQTLVPEGRYAQMNNVWFMPSPSTLVSWLRKLGFSNPRVVDVNQTSLDEQRQTDWMRFHSLAQFLDPENRQLTIEGHPAPRRATLIAEK